MSNSNELDNLVDILQNLNIEENMAQRDNNEQPVNLTLLRYQADNIPYFDGNPKQLNRFITSCEHFLRAFQNVNNVNDPINICLLDTILSKLKDRAADLICSRNELNSWALIKDALMLTFADQRSIDCLIQDLITTRPLKNESPISFGMRLQDARSLLFSKLNSTLQDNQEKLIKINHYDEFALKTFLCGLPYQLQLVVRLRNPNSLEQALAFVTEEQNFVQFSRNQNLAQPPYKSNSNNTKFFQPQNAKLTSHNFTPLQPVNSPQYVSSHVQPNVVNRFPTNLQNQVRPVYQNISFRPQLYRNEQRNNWSVRNRLPSQQHPFFANQRSNNAISRNQRNNTVEPMDTSSSNSRPKPKHNFVSEELFAQCVDQNNLDQQCDDYSDHQPNNLFDTAEYVSDSFNETNEEFYFDNSDGMQIEMPYYENNCRDISENFHKIPNSNNQT